MSEDASGMDDDPPSHDRPGRTGVGLGMASGQSDDADDAVPGGDIPSRSRCRVWDDRVSVRGCKSRHA